MDFFRKRNIIYSMEKTERKELIRLIYLYLFSLVGLVLIVVGSVQLINLGLTTWVFQQADEVIMYPSYPQRIPPQEEGVAEISAEEQERIKQEQIEFEEKSRTSRRQRSAANALALIIVGAPLYLYHWILVRKVKS